MPELISVNNLPSEVFYKQLSLKVSAFSLSGLPSSGWQAQKRVDACQRHSAVASMLPQHLPESSGWSNPKGNNTNYFFLFFFTCDPTCSD